MRKILLTGAGGQLGTELQDTAPKDIQLFAFGRKELDVSDPAWLIDTILSVRPSVLINAAAYTSVDEAEQEPEIAEKTNSLAPRYLAQACRDSGTKLIHVSTDFVFDGSANSPYKPNSKTSPLGVYGKTKLRGEEAIQKILPNSLIFRTSWVYSSYGRNFVKTMLRLLETQDEVSVVEDQKGSPTWASGLAKTVWAASHANSLRGIYHWSDDGVCSWYQFAQAIALEAKSIGIIQRCAKVKPILSRNYKTLARRPAYSVLDLSSTMRDLAISPLPWRRQLRSMLENLKGKIDV